MAVAPPRAVDRGINIPLLLSIALALALAGFGVWWLSRDPGPQTGPVLTAEAKAYVRNLGLTDVSMKAAESYMKQTVVEINGNITNKGDRPVQLVEVNCIFSDPHGQTVLRERVPIVRSRLDPGQTRAFRLPFDNIPQSWNNAMPQLVIAQVRF